MDSKLFSKKESRYKVIPTGEINESEGKSAPVGQSPEGPEGCKTVSTQSGAAESTSFATTPGKGSDEGHKAPIASFDGKGDSCCFNAGGSKN